MVSARDLGIWVISLRYSKQLWYSRTRVTQVPWWSREEVRYHPTDDTEPAGTKQLLLYMVSSSSAGNIFCRWINGVLLLYNLFLKITYFLWSYAALRSVGSVVRGASEHLLRILPAAGKLCKLHVLLQRKHKRCTIRVRKCTLRN